MSVEFITVSTHAEDRWLRRAGPTVDCEPAEAWFDAVTLTGHGLDVAEVRYHAASETVLLRKRRTLVTVLDARFTAPRLQESIERAGGVSA